jgi:hypothetical protein
MLLAFVMSCLIFKGKWGLCGLSFLMCKKWVRIPFVDIVVSVTSYFNILLKMSGTNHTKSKLSLAVICQFSFCDNADVLLQCHAVSCNGGVGVGNQEGHRSLTTCCGLLMFWFHKCTGHLLLFGQCNCYVEGLEQVTCAVIVTAN